MSRPEKPEAEDMSITPNPAALAEVSNSLNMVAAMNSEAAANANALATQLGYEGALTVDALEDEIRFYQRRTVDALLETGKRLLLLRELTDHGEFEQKVETLGFSTRSAQRFMQAAAKTAKSANLALLSSQVKNASAFLELITHDDDDLESLKELDDIDRLSASQLRKKLRETEADYEASQKRNAKLAQENADLAVRAEAKIAANPDWPEALEPLIEQIGAAGRQIALSISTMAEARTRLSETANSLEYGEREKFDIALGHVGEVYDQALTRAERDIGKERLRFDQMIGIDSGSVEMIDVADDADGVIVEAD